ncbi:EspG family protein [Amycolatopsis arida]|uniref:EspG family protein n=1 Tax=Amycolatopsis arida TaxID=587909 RepID=A0A1I5LP84_9PSEU|nr:ESX secretion-associated protein EspG [Amycolatopsis arida]TDX93787.1 ESAT-6 protein secretion system EspG family protein [Amycolatopsis arida]SFO98977.1 EspG family protein [Amycolatopsis arida]
MTGDYRPLPLPRLALLRTWADEGLGEPHPVLGGNGYYLPAAASAKLDRLCGQWYEDLGLSAGGRLARPFRRLLRTLADAGREVYCWSSFAEPSRDQAVLVAVRDDTAARLVVRGGLTWLDTVDTDRWLEEFLATLPAAPPAPARPLTVEKSTLDSPGDPLAEDDPAADLRDWLAAERDAVHQVFTAVREPEGRRVRGLRLTILDLTHHGRIVTFLRDGTLGQDVHLRPGTTGEITAALDGLGTEIARR